MRVALYERVSTEEQKLHGLSIDAQKAALEAWAADKTIVDHYTDLGVSARKPILKRPELQRLLKDCEQGLIDVVCFTRLDRWTRNIREYYKAQDVLDANHVAWRAVQEDYETVTAAGRLKVNIMLAVAQDEADRTSERIKAVFQRKRERGLVPTASVPLGIRIEDGRYVPSDAAQKVREIFQAYINTRSMVQVAKKYGYTPEGISYMLSNQTYRAAEVIDLQTWENVQEIKKTRSQRHVRSDRVYLFSGILRCPYCGNRLSVSMTNGYTYYRCKRQMVGCKGAFVSEKKVEEYLLSHLMQEIEAVNITVSEKKKRPVDVPALKRKQDRLTDLYMDDLITKEKYAEDFKAIQKQIEDAEREKRPIDSHEVSSLLDAYKEWSTEARKVFWSNLLKSVTPSDDGFSLEFISA